MIATSVLIAGGLLLIGAALQDLIARSIRDELSVTIAGLGFGLRLLEGSATVSLIVAGSVFGVCWVLFAFGLIGGADVKLLAAVTLLLPLADTLSFLVGVSLSGGLIALVFLATRRRIGRPVGAKPFNLIARAFRAERWRLHRGGPLPYAVAIACSALNVIFREVMPR